MNVLVIHGPNLNLLGAREPELYGPHTLAQIDERVRAAASELGMTVDARQTQREGEIVEWLHEAAGRVSGALLNPAAYSHTSRAIAGAVRALPYPVIEVHLSNIHAREPWRRESVTAEAARGIVAGFGVWSYVAALHALRAIVEEG